MDTERFRRAEELFWEALELNEHQLDTLLNHRCEDDYSLIELVVALVERDRDLEGSSFLEPIVHYASPTSDQ